MFENDDAFRRHVQDAVQTYWRVLEETGGLTQSGRHMAGFITLVQHVVNRVDGYRYQINHRGKGIELPGYYRRTKNWDLIVTGHGQIAAVIELKSMSGAYGKNFNNRLEEALGSGKDLRDAINNGVFGNIDPPFLGWMILVNEDDVSSDMGDEPLPDSQPAHVFQHTSYINRFQILCRRLMEQGLYDAATIIKSQQADGRRSGAWSDVEDIIYERQLDHRHINTSLYNFFSTLHTRLQRLADRHR